MDSDRTIVINARSLIVSELQKSIIPAASFHFVESIEDAKQFLTKQPYSVGLIFFDSFSIPRQIEVETLISAASMTEWIAIAEPRVMESTALKAFVLSEFRDYHTLPLDFGRLGMAIGHARGMARLRLFGVGQGNEETNRFGICGRSPAMQAFFQHLAKVIHGDDRIFIRGETGTGKELVADAIHRHSARSAGPIVVLNSGAIPDTLIQSELFGYEKGAFTGAVQRHIGSIEAANGGTLFLDEVGDLPMSQQANLLRVLQEQTITRLGSTATIPVNFRLISATHVDLQEAVRAGRFREDLYYRLNVVHLDLPPLRARTGDVSLLADVFFRRYLAGNGNGNRRCRAKGFSAQALLAMDAYHWPGNVRELINRVHRAVILSDNKLMSPSDLGLGFLADELQISNLEDARASFDRIIVGNCLRANANNMSKAARQLGVSRVTLYRILNRQDFPEVQGGVQGV